MKFITLIFASLFAFSVLAEEPNGPHKAPDGMKLAKKKDHSKDKKPIEKKVKKK
jgi:hypothetical protein